MMHRQNEMSASVIGHLHGLFRGAVRMDPGIVSPDRHDRQVDRAQNPQFRERIAKRSVAAEKDTALLPLKNIAVITPVSVAPYARTPMFDTERGDVNLTG